MTSSTRKLFIFTLTMLSTFSLIFATAVIDCSIPEITIQLDNIAVTATNLDISFSYNRNSLEVYQYPGTPSVNLFISDSQVSFKGKVKEQGILSGVKTYQSQLIGFGNIVDPKNYTKGLKDCTFFTTDDNGYYYHELSDRTQSEVFQVVEKCVTQKLCEKLGGVKALDILKAQQNKRNLEPFTLWDGGLIFAYPKLTIAHDPEKDKMYPVGKESKLNKAADLIVVGTREQLHGHINVPDIKRGLMSAKKGSFSNVHEMYITDDIVMRATLSGRKVQRFSFGFNIVEAFLNYEEFKAISALPMSSELCISVENITFTATVEMDFGGSHCLPSVKKFNVENPGKPRTELCGRNDIGVVSTVLEWFVSNWYREGLAALAKKSSLLWSATCSSTSTARKSDTARCS